MTWLQQEVRFATDPLVLQERLYAVSLIDAATQRFDREIALFARTSADYEKEYWLLSPAAAKHVSSLPGTWEETDPFSHQWAVVYSAGVTATELGLKPGSVGT